MILRSILTHAASVYLLTTLPAAGAAQGGDPCDPNAPSASFLSAANDIQYGCGYLSVSEPPQYALAESNFRLALGKEPGNATAHYLLGIALAGAGRVEEGKLALAEALRLDPQIETRMGALFRRRPGLGELAAAARGERPATVADRPAAPATPAAPAAPTTPANPTTPAAPAPPRATTGAFAVGSAVEVQYRAGEWIPGVVVRADPGSCPYYRVRADAYGRGNPSELGYACGSVRAPTGVKQPVAACGGSNPNCRPTSPPPPGRYTCDVVRWDVAARQARSDYQGYFELMAGGRYRWLDNGGTGTYAYDPATLAITWRTGPMQSRGGRSEYGLDGTTPEVTITFETEYTRRTGNQPVRWQCGLSTR